MTKKKIRCVNKNLVQQVKCELRGCSLDICTEEYISKTCGRCGILNNVVSRDVFSYGLIVDRDVNGARNIAIKRLKELVLLPWSYTWVKGNLHVQICRLTNTATWNHVYGP